MRGSLSSPSTGNSSLIKKSLECAADLKYHNPSSFRSAAKSLLIQQKLSPLLPVLLAFSHRLLKGCLPRGPSWHKAAVDFGGRVVAA